MKKLICILLAAVMFLSVFSILSSAGVRPKRDSFSKSNFAAKNYLTQYVLTKETYHSSNGGFYDERTYEYDKNGLLLSDVAVDDELYNRYDKNGTLVSSYYIGTGSNDFSRSFQYDKSRNLTEYENSSDDWGHYTREFTYDSKGNLKKEVYTDVDEYEYSDEENEYYPTVYTYKYSGSFLTEVKITENGMIRGEKTYNYDSAGRLIEAAFSKDGKTKESFSYIYDAVGNLVRETKVTDGEYDDYEYNYTYDAKGLLVKESGKEPMDWTYETTYEYDSAKRLIKETYSNSNGYKYNAKYSYDSKGRLKKAVDGSYTENYSYDKNGNLSKKVRKDSDGNITTATYKYKKLEKPICLISGIRLSHSELTYNGKARKPSVTIDGMFRGADYKVIYENNVKPGKATITITFTDPRIPPVKISFLIRPAKTTGLKVSKKAKTSVTLAWKKTPKAEKYAVYKYIDKSKAYKKVAVVKANKATIKNLRSKTVYKFCVKAISGGVASAAYSAKVKTKTK